MRLQKSTDFTRMPLQFHFLKFIQMTKVTFSLSLHLLEWKLKVLYQAYSHPAIHHQVASKRGPKLTEQILSETCSQTTIMVSTLTKCKYKSVVNLKTKWTKRMLKKEQFKFQKSTRRSKNKWSKWFKWSRMNWLTQLLIQKQSKITLSKSRKHCS